MEDLKKNVATVATVLLGTVATKLKKKGRKECSYSAAWYCSY